MKPNVVVLLFVSGGISCVLSIVRPVSHKYHLISSLKTWPNAQQYCRKNYDDLATIASDSDYARIKKQIIKDRVSSFIWLGMYNDVNSWRWSYNEISLKDTTLSKWAEYEPANIGGHEWCVTIDTFGNWRDYTCTIPRPFVCLNADNTGSQRFIGIAYPYLDWYGALAYCRRYYTDLASAITLEDNNQIASLVNYQGSSWFGLYRDNWKWSDGTDPSFIWLRWFPGAPSNIWGQEDCGIIYNYLFTDSKCTKSYFFYCHTTPAARYQQVLKLQITSDDTMLDPAVQAIILKLIMQKLDEKGMLENSTVTWRAQSDGTIFQKKKMTEL